MQHGTTVFSGMFKTPGYWEGTKGFLSSDKYLQDNFYYQEFSYVIKSKQFINRYRDVVKNLIHPSGTALFGSFESNFQANHPLNIITTITSQENANLTISISGFRNLSGVGLSIFSNGDLIVITNNNDTIEEGLYVINTAINNTSANITYDYVSSTLISGSIHTVTDI